jgi:hypothetical protein
VLDFDRVVLRRQGFELRLGGFPLLARDVREEMVPYQFGPGLAVVAAIGVVDERQRAVRQEARDHFGLVLDGRPVAEFAYAQGLLGLDVGFDFRLQVAGALLDQGLEALAVARQLQLGLLPFRDVLWAPTTLAGLPSA